MENRLQFFYDHYYSRHEIRTQITEVSNSNLRYDREPKDLYYKYYILTLGDLYNSYLKLIIVSG